jgi:MFS family permease
MGISRSFDALREREFRLLFAGQAVSLLGDGMVAVALAFAVLEISDSASALGIVLAARTAPLVVLLLVGGVAADRVSRRAVMVSADLVRCASQAAIAVLLIAGVATVAELAALSALAGAATAFFNPASTGLLPMTVSASRLQQANALRGLAQAAGYIAGPALAGVLVAGAGPGWALAVDAVTFAVSAAFLARLRLAAHVRGAPSSFLRDLRGGWDEFRSRTWVWTIVVSAAVGNMLGASYRVLGPVVAKHSLGGARAWALIATASGIGAFLGGVAILRIHPRRPLVVALLGVVLWPVSWLLLVPPAPTGVIAAAAFAGGAGLMVFNALWETALQQNVPAVALSRVSAYDWFGSIAFEPVGTALVGVVAVSVGTGTTLWVAGALNLLSIIAVLAVPSVRRLTHERSPEPAQPEPASSPVV